MAEARCRVCSPYADQQQDLPGSRTGMAVHAYVAVSATATATASRSPPCWLWPAGSAPQPAARPQPRTLHHQHSVILLPLWRRRPRGLAALRLQVLHQAGQVCASAVVRLQRWR